MQSCFAEPLASRAQRSSVPSKRDATFQFSSLGAALFRTCVRYMFLSEEAQGQVVLPCGLYGHSGGVSGAFTKCDLSSHTLHRKHGCQVSIATLVAQLRVLRRRIPSQHLPHLEEKNLVIELRRNLRELAGLKVDGNDGNLDQNAARRFWQWLRRQYWRKMLPEAKQRLGCSCFGPDPM